MSKKTLTINDSGFTVSLSVESDPTVAPAAAPPDHPYQGPNGDGEAAPQARSSTPRRKGGRGGKRGPMSEAQKAKIRASLARTLRRKARHKGGGGKRAATKVKGKGKGR
jgi:hypothetical protein